MVLTRSSLRTQAESENDNPPVEKKTPKKKAATPKKARKVNKNEKDELEIKTNPFTIDEGSDDKNETSNSTKVLKGNTQPSTDQAKNLIPPHNNLTLANKEKEKESDLMASQTKDTLTSNNNEKLDLTDLISRLQSCISHDQHLSVHCRQLIASAYEMQTGVEYSERVSKKQFLPTKKTGKPALGPLPTVEINSSLDVDQLWEEIELRNKPLISYMQKRLYKIEQISNQEKAKRDKERLQEEEAEELDLVSKEDDDNDEMIPSDQVENLEKSEVLPNDDEVTKYDNDENLTASEKKTEKKKKRVRFSTDNIVQPAVEQHKSEIKSPGLEDGFFNIDDMEMFADEAESLAVEGKLIASDEEEDDDDDGEEQNESESDNEELDADETIIYTDFFDPPNTMTNKNQITKAAKTSELLDSLEDEDIETTPQTPLEKERVKDRATIDALEEANVQKRSWALRGEVAAFSRPKDSLLDVDVEHDMAVKPKAFLTNETTTIIEDVIKQRIVDNLFDDVVLAPPEEYEARKRGKGKEDLPEISQEKPIEGLADIYAREFTEQAERKKREMLSSNEVQKEQDQPETPQQREVNMLFEKLSQKLDALSSLHFTPLSRNMEETSVKSNVKALASEEAIPENVSDGNLLTAKEVFTVSKEKDHTAEGSKEERRAGRRRRKSQRRKKNAAKKEIENTKVQNDPALAAKRKAENALQRRGKKGKIDTGNNGLVNIIGKT